MPDKIIVITGSTRGIGFGLAEAFLKLGCSVMVSGRNLEAVNEAAARLRSGIAARHVSGLACDVTYPEEVQALWDRSVKQFGRVDIWINNAGWSGEQGMIWERPADEVQAIVRTNILGTVYGSQVAMGGMREQGHGAIYNMEGMGGDGRKHKGLTMYGTTKYATHYFTESMALEAKGVPVIIGSLRPGMVMTDMIADRYKDRPEEWERAKRIFNVIADTIENVSAWMARRILENQKSGVVLAYSSGAKLLWRFVTQPFVKRDLFAK